MLDIKIICVGNLKDKEYISMCEEYLKRISRFAQINICQIKEKNNLPNINQVIESESCDILSHINSKKSVLLDVKGESFSSEQLASFLQKWQNENSEIYFIIGGSYGTSESLKNQITTKISMSKMTFPHRLARVMLLEQIYRALTINNNVSYHK